MASMIGVARPLATWTAGRDCPRRVSTSGRGQASARAASSAGRIAGRQARAHAPRRAAEREVGDRREARLVLAQREQQVRGPVGRRQLAVDLHAPAVDAAAARAGPAARPPPRRARRRACRAPAPARSRRAARARRGRAGRRAARAPCAPAPSPARGRGRTTLAPRLAYSAGMPQACTTRDRRDRERERLERDHQRRGREERDRVRERAQRPQPPAPAQARGVEPRPPVDGRGLRQDGRGGAHPPAIGRRRITSSASRGSSRTCSACPSPVLTTA